MIFNPATNQHSTKLRLLSLLLSFSLLAAQSVSLWHGLDHPFHPHSSDCLSYTALEKTEQGFISAPITLPQVHAGASKAPVFKPTLGHHNQDYALIRAPPVLL